MALEYVQARARNARRQLTCIPTHLIKNLLEPAVETLTRLIERARRLHLILNDE